MNYKMNDLEIEDWYLLAKLLYLCCELSDSELELDISDNVFEQKTTELEGDINYNQIDFMMKNLGDNGVIEWFASSYDDSYKPEFKFVFNKKTFNFLRTTVLNKFIDDRKQLLKKISELENEIESIYKFNPKKLNENIVETNNSATVILSEISKNDHLRSLEKPVHDFIAYLEKIRSINDSYNDIFTHIVRPIQEEGEKGVRATVKWAMLSIVIATIVSLLITNWSSIKPLIISLTMVFS